MGEKKKRCPEWCECRECEAEKASKTMQVVTEQGCLGDALCEFKLENEE